VGLRCVARAPATACGRELDSSELVAGAAVRKLYRDEAKLVGWLARAEEGRKRVLRGELGVEVRGAGVRRRRLRASRGGMAWSGRQRRSSVHGLDDHGSARASERRGRERARCRGRFDHESELAVREASRRISGPNSALLVLMILLSSQLILIKVVNTRVLHTRSSSTRTRCGPTSGRTTTWRPWSPSRAGRGVSVSGNCSAEQA